MSTTTAYTCSPGVWTQVSTGSTNVTVQGPPFSYRVAVGTAAPASLSTGITVTENDGMFGFSGLAATDNVYVTPTGGVSGACGVQVIAS